jgi:hypothetical protein
LRGTGGDDRGGNKLAGRDSIESIALEQSTSSPTPCQWAVVGLERNSKSAAPSDLRERPGDDP